MRQGYSTSGGNDQGTWGVLPEETYDLSTTLSLWSGNHTMKTGASFTYDVTEQLFAPLQNGRYTFAGSPTAAPTPFQFSQAFALTPEARLMFPKAYVLAGFFQDDWRVRNNLTINLGLRYDVEIIKDIPDWPAGTDKPTTSIPASGSPGIPGAIRSGPSAAALATSRSSTRSSPS